MSNVKVFRVIGEIKKPNFKTRFRREVRALREVDAVEKIYTNLGSKHRAKRFQIIIVRVDEIQAEKIETPFIRKLTVEEKENV